MNHLLIVEDNPGDQLLLRRAFSRQENPPEVHTVGDGIRALAFLRHESGFGEAPRPAVVLLDLNMPGLDGFGVLSELKGDSKLRDIPVVVFSSSDVPADIKRAYTMGASSYIVKPEGLEGFYEVADAVRRYWFGIVELPLD